MSHVLIVDHDERARDTLAQAVSAAGFTVASAGDVVNARLELGRRPPEAVVLDMDLAEGDGLSLMHEIGEEACIIATTEAPSLDRALTALRSGAVDLLVKPVDETGLRQALQRVPRTLQGPEELVRLKNDVRRLGRFGALLGSSGPMLALYEQIARVAPTEATVLLVGESGTGKDLVAQTIHELSARRKAQFVAVNCGAISPSLMESELFGHERGSFTGAERLHRGYFERADGGTLFLDEITEMSLELQVKLLRVLETGKVTRVGGQAQVDVEVRVIAATNRHPEHAIATGKLRQDLYHRLNVFPVQVPPLRARDDDVERLAAFFLEELNRLYGTHKTLSENMRRYLRTREWPGNVRELKNYIYRAFILADDEVEAPQIPAADLAPVPHASETVPVPLGSTLAEAEKLLIHATLRHCGGLKRRAAEVLGISSKTLYNRLEAYKRQDRTRSESWSGDGASRPSSYTP